MRKLLFAIGLLLALTGMWVIASPRESYIVHQANTRSFRRSGWIEHVSKEGSVAYGVVSTLFGAALLYVALLSRTGTGGGDRAIAEALVAVAPELSRRYGRIEDCTRSQVLSVSRDLGIDADFLPCLFAAFLGRSQLADQEAHMPEVDWKAVEATVERILLELPHEALGKGHFHPSWSAA